MVAAFTVKRTAAPVVRAQQRGWCFVDAAAKVPPNRPTKLVRQIVKAAHDLTKHKRPPYWMSVYDVIHAIGGRVSPETSQAIRLAASQDLLRADGADNPHSICVTAEGVKLANRP